MKRLNKMLFLFFLLFGCKYLTNPQLAKENMQRQIGVYKIDCERTNLAGYIDDSSVYKKLTVKFNSDSTFQFNMKVPFIYDSIGTWLPAKGDIEDWNWMFYKNSPISTQFTEPHDSDSTFYMNSVTPQKGFESVSVIYFRKLSR